MKAWARRGRLVQEAPAPSPRAPSPPAASPVSAGPADRRGGGHRIGFLAASGEE